MGYKILLVDDDTELVKMLSKYFERKKYKSNYGTKRKGSHRKITDSSGYYFTGY